MGADIHAYLEYKEKNSSYWRSMTANFGSRDYLWFSIVAGVRGSDYQIFEPKGIIEAPRSYHVDGDLWLRVEENDEAEYNEGSTSLKRANEWVKHGSSIPRYSQMEADKLLFVSNPDSHSHSWLTKDELSEAIDKYKEVVKTDRAFTGWSSNLPAEWIAVWSAMVGFEMCGYETRLVFWFDN